jgi:hypothetical protein
MEEPAGRVKGSSAIWMAKPSIRSLTAFGSFKSKTKGHNMNWISATAASLLLITIGLTIEAQAVTSGTYRCVALQSSFDSGITTTVPVIMHYNPNGGLQSITRIRVFNSVGVVLFDQSIPVGALTVPGQGSLPVLTGTSNISEGLQFIINWRQTVDAAAPIPRLDLVHIDVASSVVQSMSQSNCP